LILQVASSSAQALIIFERAFWTDFILYELLPTPPSTAPVALLVTVLPLLLLVLLLLVVMAV
jgi:hypothetical protein